MKTATRLNLLRERVSDSESVEKAKNAGASVSHFVKEVSGFLAWRLGKSIRLGKLREGVRKAYAEYLDELNTEE